MELPYLGRRGTLAVSTGIFLLFAWPTFLRYLIDTGSHYRRLHYHQHDLENIECTPWVELCLLIHEQRNVWCLVRHVS